MTFLLLGQNLCGGANMAIVVGAAKVFVSVKPHGSPFLGDYDDHRITSLIIKNPQPRTAAGQWALVYCRVLRGEGAPSE